MAENTLSVYVHYRQYRLSAA